MIIFNQDGIQRYISNNKLYLFKGKYPLLSIDQDGILYKTQYFAEYFPEINKESNNKSIKLLMIDLYDQSGFTDVLNIENVTCIVKHVENINKKICDTLRNFELVNDL